MASKASIDSELVRTLADILDDTGLTEIEYEKDGLRLRIARQGIPMTAQAMMAAPMHMPAAAPAAAPAAVEPTDYATHPGAVTAPMVGVVYVSPEPGAAPFISLGDMVSAGQTLFLIEAMKTFNPVRASKAGKITKILVQDGTPVEYGEPLLVIE